MPVCNACKMEVETTTNNVCMDCQTQQKVDAFNNMWKWSINFQVKFTPEEMPTYLKQEKHYNEYDGAKVREMIQKIDALTPTKYYNPGNPNNGKPHHVYNIGREGSPVIYLEIRKIYMPNNFDYDTYTMDLKRLAYEAEADEAGIITNNDHEFIARFWWD